MILKSILIGLVAMIGYLDDFTGASMIARPIVTGPIVGLVLGDVHQGIVIGATLELIWMGIVAVGAAIPPDVITGGVLGTAFAIISGKGPEVALALAVPIAMLAQLIKNAVYIFRAVLVHKADKYAEEGNASGIERMHVLAYSIIIVSMGIINAVSFYFGSSVMEKLLKAIPAFIMDGLSVATGLLPALGFALLAQMTMTKKLAPFFALGFILAAYSKLPMLAIAGIGVVMALIILDLQKQNKGVAVDDNDF